MSSEDASGAARDFAMARAIHSEERNMLDALRAYAQVIEIHASAPEAGYSRARMRNIAGLVASAGELLASRIELVLRHLQPQGDGSTNAVSP